MRIIKPRSIVPPITANSLSQPSGDDPAVWASGTTYNLGDRVYVAGAYKIYECIVTTSLGGFSPEVSVTKASPKWLEIGYTNAYAMFDPLRSTTSKSTSGTIDFTFTQSSANNSIVLLGLVNVQTVRIICVEASTTYYDQTFELSNRDSGSWYDYFYNYLSYKNNIAIMDLPYTGTPMTIQVILTGAGSNLEIGSCIVGNYIQLGRTQLGILMDTLNFSTIDRDDFGNSVLVPRRNVPKLSLKTYLDKSEIPNAMFLRRDLNAVSVVWVALDSDISNYLYSDTIVFGIYRNYDLQLDNPIGTVLALELEEI